MNNYSQNNEQEIIQNFFKGNVGRFLDVGAHDGESLSNTRALALSGWAGCLVEPHPLHFHRLWQLYGGRKDMALVNGAVATSLADMGLAKLFFNYEGPAYSSTLSDVKAEEFKANDYSKSFHICPFHITDLQEFAPFDFISIDIEGMELSILSGDNPVDDISELIWHDCERPTRLMCVEVCPKSKHEIIRLLAGLSFYVIAETPENVIAELREK